MANWHIGQKVACISDDWEDVGEIVPCNNVVKGNIYTIHGIEAMLNSENVWLMLEEIPEDDLGVCRFESDGFKPVQTTDISIFTRMLKPTLEKILDDK